MNKIVIIAIPGLLIGGTEIQTLNLVNVLVSTGYKVTVCCYYEYEQEMVTWFETAGAKVILLKYERAKGLWYLAKGLIQLYKTIKPDIVHVQYIAPGLVPILAAKMTGVKTIFATVHQPGRVYGLKEKLLLRTAAGFCSAFFCVSKSVEESWFGNSELFDPQKANRGRRHFTVYNAVDVEMIVNIVKEADGQVIKKSLGIDGKKVLGVIGRLREEKGQAVLLDAMAEVIKTIPDAILLVVGDGPDRMSLELRAKSLGLVAESKEQRAENRGMTTESNILWLGQLSPEEVYQSYSIMDVVAVPSFFEGFGLSAAEAMAAGVPVVASKVDGLTEVLEDSVTGILVPPRNSAALATAITKLFAGPEQAADMGRKGQDRVREIFSVKKFRRSMMEAYRLAD